MQYKCQRQYESSLSEGVSVFTNVRAPRQVLGCLVNIGCRPSLHVRHRHLQYAVGAAFSAEVHNKQHLTLSVLTFQHSVQGPCAFSQHYLLASHSAMDQHQTR